MHFSNGKKFSLKSKEKEKYSQLFCVQLGYKFVYTAN